VLDPDASVKTFRDAAQRDFLNQRMRSSEDAVVFVGTELVRYHAARRSALLVKSRFSRTEISAAISELSENGMAVEFGDLVLDAKWWADFRRRAISEIEDEHRAHPNRVGLNVARLRSVLGSEMPLPEVFDALVSELCKNGFAHSGQTIQRATHQPTLPHSLRSVCARIRAGLAAKPFDPPSGKDLAPDAISQQALRFLCDTEEIVRITDDIFLGSEEFAKMRDAVVEVICAKGSASVSDLRQTLGSSRRVIVPFLERLDRDGVTRRVGDQRTLSQAL
jgi:selenocysteine-specific elongation factor